MTTPVINPFHRTDTSPEAALFDRLDFIVNKPFRGSLPPASEYVSYYTEEDMEEYYGQGISEVKDYLRDSMRLYIWEKGSVE